MVSIGEVVYTEHTAIETVLKKSFKDGEVKLTERDAYTIVGIHMLAELLVDKEIIKNNVVK